MRLLFRGYSDDIFGEYEATCFDIDNCANGDPIEIFCRALRNSDYANPEIKKELLKEITKS